MASTPRPHRFAIPMATRSTDVADLAKCPGAWILKLFHEQDQADATYFELGSALHEGIEVTVREDLDLDQATTLVVGRIEDWLSQIVKTSSRVLESSTRGMDTMLDDATRMMANWFRWVHPDSEKRHPAYSDYHWPPRVEVPFYRTAPGLRYPVWGSIDAIFTAKTQAPGHFAIVDWKSGTSRQRNSDQLHFYTFGSELDVGAAWFHHLDRVQARAVVQEADPYPGDTVVRRRIRAAEDMKDYILTKQRVKFEPSVLCNWCTVREFCPQEGSDKQQNMLDLSRMLKLARPMHDIQKEVA